MVVAGRERDLGERRGRAGAVGQGGAIFWGSILFFFWMRTCGWRKEWSYVWADEYFSFGKKAMEQWETRSAAGENQP